MKRKYPTVKELIDRLSQYPDDAEVVVDVCGEYSDCEICEVRPSCGREGEIEKMAHENVVVIDVNQY